MTMKPRKLVLVSFLLAAISLNSSCKKSDPQPISTSVEFLSNPTIETGSSQPSNWFEKSILKSGNVFQFDWSLEQAFSPTHSLKISATTQNPTDFAYWGQNVLVQVAHISPGRNMILKVKIKAANLTGNGAAIAIGAYSGAVQAQLESTQTSISINGTFDWKDYTVTLKARSDITSFTVFLFMLPNTTGTVYFDDASFTSD